VSPGLGEPHDAEPEALARLGTLRTPTLVVTGPCDVPGTLACARAAAGAIPGAESAEIADTAHLPSLERPDSWNALVLAFLARHGLPDPRSSGASRLESAPAL